MSDTEKNFKEPQLAINRVYTRKGDAGQTRLVGGQVIQKHALRIECYGTVDELNSFIGRCAVLAEGTKAEHLVPILKRVQNTLFNLGSILATLPEDVGERMPRVREEDITRLEQEIDAANEELPSLTSFVLPGGSLLNAELHVARTVCRRAERHCVRLRDEGAQLDQWSIPYLNRLSDALFVWSRVSSTREGIAEVLWAPNRG